MLNPYVHCIGLSIVVYMSRLFVSARFDFFLPQKFKRLVEFLYFLKGV